MDALGYFDAHIKTELLQERDCWRLHLRINPGEQAIVNAATLRLTGGLKDVSEFDVALPIVGDRFQPDRYERRKRNLLERVRSQGYLDVRFDKAEVLVESGTAQIHWALDSGPQYRFGYIEAEQDVLDETLFHRYLSLAEGEPYSSAAVLESYRALISSDYFKRVTVEPAVGERTDGEVPVSIRAVAADKWSVLGGAGFSTDTGPRLRARAQARYLNSGGPRGGLDSLLSPVRSHVSGQYRWPYGDPTHQWYTLKGRVGYEDTDSAESSSLSLGLHRAQRLGRHWTQTISLDYLVEDYDVSADEGRAQLVLFGHNLTFTSAIDERRPRRGRTVSLDVKAGARALASDNDVVQVRVAAKQILPLPYDARLLLRGQIGYSWQESFAQLPPTLRFFAGGDNSVRGYALDELGPEDAAGDNLGGQRLAVGSIELDFPVRENWSAALFADSGSAWDDEPEFSNSIGFGVRWYSPLGPIRIDLAHPLDDDAQVVRLHLSIGPDL